MQLRYGMNPHQAARATIPADGEPVRVISGEPSYINMLDALNGWQLVREAASATGMAAAASFKHVSLAGVALADAGAPAAAYTRARDVDPKSSFGDMIAVSEPVDIELAEYVTGIVSDGIIAPGFDPGTVAMLTVKKRGAFLILEADTGYEPPEWEQRDLYGVLLEQQRDRAPLTTDLITAASPEPLPRSAARDGLLGLVTVRYTQSNSVALVHDGAALGIGAGQQNRVDCIRLAAAKAATWWLRRHQHIRDLPEVPGMSRQDRLNWQVRMAEADMTPRQLADFADRFPGTQPYLDAAERDRWLARLDSVTLSSDGYLPFRDNIDHASRIGVRYVIEPGGSIRSDEVQQACAEYGMTLVRTGLRLFHH